MDVQASADSACLLGDSLRGLGRTGEALKAYERSIALGAAPIWSYFHAIDIFCEQNDYDAAFEVLRHAFRPWRNKVEFRHKLRRCVELFFQYRSRQAHELYRRGSSNDTGSPERASADSLLRETLDRIKGLYLELDDLPAPLANQPDGYVTILANDGLRQCTHYRIEQKVEQFEAAGIPVRVFSHDDVEGFIDSLVGARAAIFYRVAAFPKVIRAILHANSMGLTTYYEIDDLIFDPGCYPDPFDSFEGQVDSDEYAGLQFGVPLFRYALSMCNASIASTEALSSKMRSLTATPLSIVLPNALDSRTEQWIRIGAERPIDENRRIRVFYGSGTRAHNADFNELVGPALLDVMRRFPQVDLVIVGHLTLRPDLAAMADRLHVYPFTPDIDAYWSILASCDVNLAVLHPGEVADCKSEIKWLEAAIFQIPSIVSETATYRKVVANGVDGYIASNGEDWINHLSKLVVDGAARRRMGANARSKALREYSPEAGAKILERAFGESGKKAREPGDRKRLRVLICNVFFHPQSHGGATRVVEDNIRSFQRLNDDLELGVFCSDEGVAPSGQLRMGAFADIPVYRLSTPIEPGMDWRPFNTENAASFGRVLDHFRPDIVHFHCIQRLTASIVEETLQREIPYLVTFHDGWWISDNQFLVDEDGFLRLPTSDIINDCRNRPSPLESIERRQRLQSLLRNAKVLLAVSAQFAEVYGNAGIERVHSVENGLPEHQVATRKRRPDGRLALGHIGGRSAHKGAFLIEATLRQEHYDNLHVTMVDGTLPAGERVETTWGTTPVTLTGPYPQSEVGQLYGHLDVLLAPSTWPESYGLVTREALWHGLWVVASNLGAIADGIQPGRNGFVIDTSTTADLKKILHELDKQPDYYSNSPDASTRTLRSSSEQARELHQIYWEIARATGRPRDCEHRSRAA
jgi:glycosyltransferase involved in cell wall biosynthesis